MENLTVVGFIFSLIGALLAGLVAGVLITRALVQKQMRDNPPYNEQMIRNMFSQMGVTPSEKKVRQVMASMQAADTSKKKVKEAKPAKKAEPKKEAETPKKK